MRPGTVRPEPAPEDCAAGPSHQVPARRIVSDVRCVTPQARRAAVPLAATTGGVAQTAGATPPVVAFSGAGPSPRPCSVWRRLRAPESADAARAPPARWPSPTPHPVPRPGVSSRRLVPVAPGSGPPGVRSASRSMGSSAQARPERARCARMGDPADGRVGGTRSLGTSPLPVETDRREQMRRRKGTTMTQTTQTTKRSGLMARLPWHDLATRTAATAIVLSSSFAGLGGALPAYADFVDGPFGPGRDHRQGQRRQGEPLHSAERDRRPEPEQDRHPAWRLR